MTPAHRAAEIAGILEQSPRSTENAAGLESALTHVAFGKVNTRPTYGHLLASWSCQSVDATKMPRIVCPSSWSAS